MRGSRRPKPLLLPRQPQRRLGLIWGEGAESIRWIGDLFVRLIRILVAPLVFTIIAPGVAAIGDTKRLGSLGVKTTPCT